MADPLPPAFVPSARVIPPSTRGRTEASPEVTLHPATPTAPEPGLPSGTVVQDPTSPATLVPNGEPNAPPRPARRWAWALLLVLVSAVLGTYLAEPPRRSGPAGLSNDLLLLLGQEPDASTRAFDNVGGATAFVRNESGAQVAAPRLDGFDVTGAGMANVPAPIPFYQLRDGETDLRVYAVTYAHLDRIEKDVRLARTIRNRVASAEPLVQPLGTTTALVWRDRATLFFAFTADDPAPLLDALR